jgi:hypothetical protein
MLYRIARAVAHPDHTVTVTWSDGIEAVVDLGKVIAKGKVFAAMQDPAYFVEKMRIAHDRFGLEWPNRVDFSADGLRFMAFPAEAAEESDSITAQAPKSAAQ